MLTRSTLLLLAVTLAAPRAALAQSRFGIHVFGASYHYQSRTYRDAAGATRHYEQLNPGVGAEYIVRAGNRALVSGEAGAYRDSKGRTNVFAGPAARLRVVSHVWLGGGIVLMTSRTYGTPIAPLPLLSAKWAHVGGNATWIPALDRRESGAVALFGTLYL